MEFLLKKEKSNNYLDIPSPIFIFIDEINQSPILFWDKSYEGDLSLSKNNSLSQGNVFNSSKNIKEKEILEKEFQKEIEQIKEKEINEEKDDEKEFWDNEIFKYIQNLPLPVPQETKKEEKEEKKENKVKDKTNKSTCDKSNNINKNEINKCIFGLKFERKIEPRIDYCIKNIKVHISKYLKKYGNELIKKCGFQNKLKKLKLFAPSYKYFTGNSNGKDNKIFFNFTIEKIFCYPEGKIEKNDNRLQRQNKDIIKQFKEYIDEAFPYEVPEQFQKLINFFNMTYQDAIKLFYESNQFKDYSSSPKTIFLDKQLIKAKGISLRDKNAFFKLMENYNSIDSK